MAALYGFGDGQKEVLAELLKPEHDALWGHLLYGSAAGGASILEAAIGQLGNVGGAPYWSWYGFPGRVEWCAVFVSWAADRCGLLDAGAFPRFAACDDGLLWFRSRGQWQDAGYVPSPGDVIFAAS